MALGKNALTTWERASSLLGFSDDQREAVEFLINAASFRANKITSRALAAREYSGLVLDGSGRVDLVLPEYPVSEIRSLWISPGRVFEDSSLVDASGYQVLAEEGVVRLLSRPFPSALASVKLDATLGYMEVPEDLELAVLECVAWNRRRFESGTMGVRAISTDGSVTSQYEITIPSTALAVFEDYRRVRA